MNDADQPLVEFAQLAYIQRLPECHAVIKQQFDDFQVDEVLGFEPGGCGEHLYLKVRKQDLGTVEVARILSTHLGVALSAVGYSGMKDRRAICTQWFSVPRASARSLAGEALDRPGLEVLETRNNDRKLRIGSHRANRFRLRLRDFKGDQEEFQARIELVKRRGVPNYYGPQRLGRGLSNVHQAQDYFRAFDEKRKGTRLSRKKKSMLLSASRSFLFNVILSRRVSDSSWDTLLAGEVMNLDGTGRFFKAQPGEEQQLHRRLAELDIHPTGLLAGRVEARDRYVATTAVAELEDDTLTGFPTLRGGLYRLGVLAGRRALRLVPKELEYTFDNNNNSVLLSFMLPAGGYATALLRELVQV